MERRPNLQTMLEELLESDEVYYNSPESKRMAYPAIVYSKSRVEKESANDGMYLKKTRYELIVIDTLPDNPVIGKLLDLPYSSHDRTYVSDNLHHDVLTLYY